VRSIRVVLRIFNGRKEPTIPNYNMANPGIPPRAGGLIIVTYLTTEVSMSAPIDTAFE
jgi:hypothetical protein